MVNRIVLSVVPGPKVEFDKMGEMQKMLQDNLSVMRKMMRYAEAKPLYSLIAVLLENVVNSREGGMCASLSSRLNYLETELISLACIIFNLPLALITKALVIVTRGREGALCDAYEKYWLHTTIAASGIAVSVLGIGSPFYAGVATGGILSFVVSQMRAAWKDLKLPSDKERVQIVKALYAQHRSDLVQGLNQLFTGRKQVEQVIETFDRAVKEARSLRELLKKCLQGNVHVLAAQN